MKGAAALIILLVMVVWGINVFSDRESQTSQYINNAIGMGEVSMIAEYFAPNVDISINNSKVNIPSAQAQKLLGEFFRINKPQAYDSVAGRNYVSGNLITVSGKQYKVDYSLKKINNQKMITGMYFY